MTLAFAKFKRQFDDKDKRTIAERKLLITHIIKNKAELKSLCNEEKTKIDL